AVADVGFDHDLTADLQRAAAIDAEAAVVGHADDAGQLVGPADAADGAEAVEIEAGADVADDQVLRHRDAALQLDHGAQAGNGAGVGRTQGVVVAQVDNALVEVDDAVEGVVARQNQSAVAELGDAT